MSRQRVSGFRQECSALTMSTIFCCSPLRAVGTVCCACKALPRPHYTPVLRKTELELFAVEDTGALCFYVLCAVKNPVAASTVNLKCPVVINPGTNEARQIIMETEAYDMRHPLADFGRGEEGATC